MTTTQASHEITFDEYFARLPIDYEDVPNIETGEIEIVLRSLTRFWTENQASVKALFQNRVAERLAPMLGTTREYSIKVYPMRVEREKADFNIAPNEILLTQKILVLVANPRQG